LPILPVVPPKGVLVCELEGGGWVVCWVLWRQVREWVWLAFLCGMGGLDDCSSGTGSAKAHTHKMSASGYGGCLWSDVDESVPLLCCVGCWVAQRVRANSPPYHAMHCATTWPTEQGYR